MQPKKNSSMIYDYAVIGSGLAGLLAAKSLVDKNFRVAVIEATEVLGGNNRAIRTPAGVFDNGIRFIPNKNTSAAAIEFLETTLGQSVGASIQEIPPVTYENGTLKSFVGFGDEPPAFYDEIIYFAEPSRWSLQTKVADWVQSLQTQLSANSLCDFFSRSIVTKFLANQDNVTSVLINGQKTLMAKNFIYAGNVRDLRLLLPEGALNQRALAKLGKNQYWTSVGLDILFENKITDSEAVHVLNGTTSDDIGPCAGIFYPTSTTTADTNSENTVEQNTSENLAKTPQFSQWISFLDDLEAEEEENIGAVLKKIKRQIKRAYPEGSDKITFERIMIVRNFGGDGELKLKEDGTIGNLKNLWIASPSMNSEKNILGAILQAKFIVNSATAKLNLKTATELSPTLDEELDI